MNSGHIGALRPDHSDETEPQTARPPYWAGLSRGLWVFARPEASLVSHPRDSSSTLGRVVPCAPLDLCGPQLPAS